MWPNSQRCLCDLSALSWSCWLNQTNLPSPLSAQSRYPWTLCLDDLFIVSSIWWVRSNNKIILFVIPFGQILLIIKTASQKPWAPSSTLMVFSQTSTTSEAYKTKDLPGSWGKTELFWCFWLEWTFFSLVVRYELTFFGERLCSSLLFFSLQLHSMNALLCLLGK